MCIKWHIHGECYENCDRKGSHIPKDHIPPAKVKEMCAFMEKCRSEKVFGLGLSGVRLPQKPPDQHSLPLFLSQHQDPQPNIVGLPGEPTPCPIKQSRKFLLPPVTQAHSLPPGSPPTFGVAPFLSCIRNNRPIQLLSSHGKIGMHRLVSSITHNFLGEPTQINNFIETWDNFALTHLWRLTRLVPMGSNFQKAFAALSMPCYLTITGTLISWLLRQVFP
jgi:hypothetical protein